jgi:C8 domain
VTNLTSLFNYTGSSYEANNPSNFVPQYNQTTSDATLLEGAESACSVLTEGEMAAVCNKVLDPTPFYDACIYDVIGTTSTEEADASIVTYASLCQELGSTNTSSSTPIVGMLFYFQFCLLDLFNIISQHSLLLLNTPTLVALELM